MTLPAQAPSDNRLSTVQRRLLFSGMGVALASVALYFWPRSDPLQGVPDGADLQTPWACHACGHVEQLSPRRRVELERRPRPENPPPTDEETQRNTSGDKAAQDQGQTSFRDVVLVCPQCGKSEFHKAKTCPRCGMAFPRVLRGEAKECPKCGPKPG